MKAALFVGGWEGHAPTDFADWYKALLEENGFKVDVHETLEPLSSLMIWPISISSRRSGLRPVRGTKKSSAT